MDYSAYSPSVNQNQKGWCLSKLINDRMEKQRKKSKTNNVKMSNIKLSEWHITDQNGQTKPIGPYHLRKKNIDNFWPCQKIKNQKQKMTNTHTRTGTTRK